METITFLQTAWFILIGVLFVGYSILDGFDLGVGILFPFIARDDAEKETLIRAIGPLWDGNEVWLLTAGGAFFAAFPIAYATVFSGFYLALMIVLFSLIFRAVSLEFWKNDERKKLWGWALFTGSIIPSLLYGVALGNVVYGVPLTAGYEFDGNFFTLLRPYPLLTGLLGLVAIIVQGSAYTALKTEGALQERARQTGRKMALLLIAIFVLLFVSALVYFPGLASRAITWLLALCTLAMMALCLFSLSKGKDLYSFIFSSLGFAGLWGITGYMLFPNLVRASNNEVNSITIQNSASGPLTLKVMFIIALIGMPFVIAYTAYVYRIFRGKVRA